MMDLIFDRIKGRGIYLNKVSIMDLRDGDAGVKVDRRLSTWPSQ